MLPLYAQAVHNTPVRGVWDASAGEVPINASNSRGQHGLACRIMMAHGALHCLNTLAAPHVHEVEVCHLIRRNVQPGSASSAPYNGHCFARWVLGKGHLCTK